MVLGPRGPFVRPMVDCCVGICPAAVLLGRSGSRGKCLGGPPLSSIAPPFDLQSSAIEECEPDCHAAVFDHLWHAGGLLEAIRAQAGKANTARILKRIGLQKNTESDERDRQDRQPHRYIPSGPRIMAAMPVRATSTRPSGNISAMNCSILSVAPVISNTKLSVVASITRARNASASRNASTRLSPFPFTLTIASSRSIALPASVMSTT